MSDTDPILFRPRAAGTPRSRLSPRSAPSPESAPTTPPSKASFNRTELTAILNLYGRKVASGAWRDYAIDLSRDTAIFSVFRRSSEVPLYRIVKDPRLHRRQGMYSVLAAGGLILKRGHDLARVLSVLEDRPELVSV